MVDFLSRDEPINFRSSLVSFAEPRVIYLNSDFSDYTTNVNVLLSALYAAKRLVSKRVTHRQCRCTSVHRSSFHAVLVNHFANRTLYSYLVNGDPSELDHFKMDIRCNFSAFSVIEVLIAYHKVRRLKEELVEAKRMIVINPFLSSSDFEDDGDSSDSGL